MAYAQNGSVTNIDGKLIHIEYFCPKCGRRVNGVTMTAPLPYGRINRTERCGYCQISFPATLSG